jgi:hypothetical protein
LNGVYFVPVIQDNGKLVQIRSRPEAGKKPLGAVKTAWIEPTLLYPLVKGAGDFEPCYLRLNNPDRSGDELYTFVPNIGIDKTDYVASETAMNGVPLARTKAWFTAYNTLLEVRSTYRRQMKGAPFYGVYNVGDYTFQPWKVVWPEMSTRFYAAVAGSSMVPVVGSRPYVPDHKVYFAGFNSKEPAHFLCGLLNTPMVREWVESHTVSIQMGDVFKHMNLPEYDAMDTSHIALSALVEKCHCEHNMANRALLVAQVEKDGEAVLTTWILAKTMKTIGT